MGLEPGKRRIGETLIDRGLLNERSVQIILLRQEYGDSRLFGEIATSLNYLAHNDLYECLTSNSAEML